MEEQVKINIVCDEGHVADFLHDLASAYEKKEWIETFETAHGWAELE